ncbi:hypothetical protein [Myxococcus phage Mx1]|nr:hypothetical protein [Myxococcus phage Mx1]
MADEFSLKLDLTPITEHHKSLTKLVEDRLGVAARHLAVQSHAHIKERAATRLRTRLEMFNEHLDFEQLDKNTWSIIVRQKGRWIEDGMEPHSMLDDLLKSPKAKRAKGGSKYIVIPFKHNKGPTQQTPHQKELLDNLKSELKARKIPYGKIEKKPDGSPRTGLLHKMDLHGPRRHMPGLGAEGPMGRPMAADHVKTPGAMGPEGRPYLWGVRIYQRFKRAPDGKLKLDKKGQPSVQRDIMTFRVASSKHAQSGKWFHPGLPPMHFLDEAYAWASDQWDNHIAPEIMRELGGF